MSDANRGRPMPPPAGMAAMRNRAEGGAILVNRPPSRLSEVEGAVSSSPPAAAPGAASPLAPAIVRPTPSRTINQGGGVAIDKAALQQKVNLNGTQVGRWYSGDPDTARTVRITVSGQWTAAPVLAGASVQQLGVMAFVQWGSQSGGTQKAWFPVPCDFEVSATDVLVSAAVCQLPYAARPKNFSGNAIAASGTAQVVCSIAEGQSDGPPGYRLASGESIDPSGSSLLPDAAHVSTIARDLILVNTGTNATYVALMDMDPSLPAGTKGPLCMMPVLVPAGGQVAVSFDDLAIWNAAWIGAFTAPDGVSLDSTNAANVFAELRGWCPGFQGGA